MARRRPRGLARRRSLHARRAGAQRRDSAGARRGAEARSRGSTAPGVRSIARCRLSRRPARAGGALLDAEPHRRRRLPGRQRRRALRLPLVARSCATATATSRSMSRRCAQPATGCRSAASRAIRAGAAALRFAARPPPPAASSKSTRADDRTGKLRMSVTARLGGAALFVAAVAAILAALVHFVVVLLVAGRRDARRLRAPRRARPAERDRRRCRAPARTSGVFPAPIRRVAAAFCRFDLVGRADAGQGAGRTRRLRLALLPHAARRRVLRADRPRRDARA